MILGDYADAAETTTSLLKQLCPEQGEGHSPYQRVMRDRLGERVMEQFRRVVYELHNGKWTLDMEASWAVFPWMRTLILGGFQSLESDT